MALLSIVLPVLPTSFTFLTFQAVLLPVLLASSNPLIALVSSVRLLVLGVIAILPALAALPPSLSLPSINVSLYALLASILTQGFAKVSSSQSFRMPISLFHLLISNIVHFLRF